MTEAHNNIHPISTFEMACGATIGEEEVPSEGWVDLHV